MPMIMPPMTLIMTTRRPAMASPRTNFDAPSMAPKKPDSSSSALRRRRASFSSTSPAERSASIAICLPGMASKWKRAATSAIRPEPLVMTTKFTITRIVKTMMPMTKLPPITNRPNASMTWPAAAVPSWPWARMSRVEARLSASRNMVAIKRMVGKAENSSGAWMNNEVISTSTENVIEIASEKSSRSGGSGRMRTIRMAIMPTASPISLRLSMVPRSASRASDSPLSSLCDDVTSVMPLDRPRRLRSRASKLCAAAGGPPARRRGAALESKAAAPEGAVETVTRPRQNVPRTWLPIG